MRHLWTESQVICPRPITTSFDQNSGDRIERKEYFWQLFDLPVGTKTSWWMFIEHGLCSRITCPSLNVFSWIRGWISLDGVLSTLKACPALQWQNSEKKGYFLDQSLGFSYSKHPITLGWRYLLLEENCLHVSLQFYLTAGWLIRL